MLVKRTNQDIQPVLDYIGEDYVQCLYMYMDVVELGAESEGLGLWTSEADGQINCVYYRYFDCLHIYGREGCVVEDAKVLLEEIQPNVIICPKDIIEQLAQILDLSDYIYESNHIITANKEMDGGREVDIKEATDEDIEEIADLMLKADIYSEVYEREALIDSLRRRLAEGFGRLFIIRDETGRMIATNATNGETDKIAVIGGLVTDPEMRGRGLGRAITASTWNLVRNEGKRGLAYLIEDNIKTITLHQKMGYDFIGYSAKLVKKA